MRQIAASALFILMFFAYAPQSNASETPSPKLIAVKHHGDWCGSCKKMGSVFTDLRNKFDGQPILFVELDLTNVSTRNQAELLASALGLKSIYNENPGTGFILLIDPKTHKVVQKLTADQNLKVMAKEITAQIKS